MALNAYLRLKGQKQGEIKGSVTQRGREGSIAVVAFSHELVSPRDAASGLPTGRRQHRPLTITKEIDRATPLLMTALVTNENLTSFELQFFQPTAAGKEAHFYTIRLTNASIGGIHAEMHDNQLPDGARLPVRERVTFYFQAISWTIVDGGITAMDDWETPVA